MTIAMAMHNFTISDLLGSLTAFSLFPLFVLVPGYAAGWLLNLFAFRSRTPAFRLALSVPLSISIGPILTYLLAHFLSMSAVWMLFSASWLYGAVLAGSGLRRAARPRISPLILALACGWTGLVLLSLVDLQLGNRLYYSVIGFDYSIRTAMIHALATTGMPPASPFFFPGSAVTLRYHYFWLILCSLVSRLGGGAFSARQALIAGTAWAGMGLMALIALYLRLFSAQGPARLRRRTAIAIALLGVTGLDIVPTLMLVLLYAGGLTSMIFPSLEWWNEQVDGWVYTMLWEPHHLCGLIACLTGFLVLWQAPSEPGRRGVLKNGLVAGLALATAVGASTHVVFVFAIFLLVWTAIAIWKKWRKDAVALIVAGVTCTLLSMPYLSTLWGPASGGAPLVFAVRRFMIPEYFMRAFGLRAGWQIAIGDLVLLPLNYFLELGLFFVVGWWRWKSCRAKPGPLDRRELAAWAMVAVSVLICTFFRSSLIDNNDLGWRGFLIAQFVLLLWTADLLAEWPRLTRKPLLACLIGLGAAGTLYDLSILRSYSVLSDRGVVPPLLWMASDRQLGRRTYAVREAYEWVGRHTRPTSLVQFNPKVLQDTAALLYADRRTIAADEDCNCIFGGDPRLCAPILTSFEELYSSQADLDTFHRACNKFPIDILVAKDTDPVWRNPHGWVWERQPVFANGYVRLFQCR
jgi:hypothetical protein